MAELTFYKDYKNDEALRRSFDELANLVFGIHFEEWYQMGYWKERYIPFSYVQGGKVVANVSVNLLDFVIEGEEKRAIQIGTVMTHPDYRNQGLSKRLMNRVLKEYENHYDFMYLFANQNVLDFYPKFGFEAINDYPFSMEYAAGQTEESDLRKLDGRHADDLNFIYTFALDRVPVSNRFGTIHDQELLMFYCLYVFNHCIYYIQDEDAIVIFEQEDKELHIFDIISKREIHLASILSKISSLTTNRIIFHFTPDDRDIKTQGTIYNGEDALFVKTRDSIKFPSQVKHPLTSKA
ncbi:GNAT family N-acetyltransferase [Pullulanibacillus sp. KACC 23026]|uniref:GNAT family N-acetyltransferase n=1 Tax=Pullulanibacillus sp. KACC 23026 TaxID=3028315 RepID=UPI0023AFCEDB|nr:GNAT family N-acetyltransferase [Pullulanibacillus sp. KACC 23026]WEG13501.1 GNAT family N-acetyltransferase [Pullulanibacillus sp. KACC 23026]